MWSQSISLRMSSNNSYCLYNVIVPVSLISCNSVADVLRNTMFLIHQAHSGKHHNSIFRCGRPSNKNKCFCSLLFANLLISGTAIWRAKFLNLARPSETCHFLNTSLYETAHFRLWRPWSQISPVGDPLSLSFWWSARGNNIDFILFFTMIVGYPLCPTYRAEV